jgi:hypothetical protein
MCIASACLRDKEKARGVQTGDTNSGMPVLSTVAITTMAPMHFGIGAGVAERRS